MSEEITKEEQDQEVEQLDEEEHENQENDNEDNEDNDENQDDGGEEEENLEENDDQEEDEGGEEDDKPSLCYIRLRGLPWSVTERDIVDFLSGANVANGEKGVYIVKNKMDGKNTGEAFVKLESEKDEEAAFKHDRENMGHRYIEIFKATAEEAQFSMKGIQKTGKIVKLRGLPYSVDEEMIEDFFDGLEIRKDREGIVIVMDRRGRVTGEAYVQFKSDLDAQKALERNRDKIGHRYIEIFRCDLGDLKRALGSRPAPYDRFGGRNNAGNRGGGPSRNRRGGGGGSGGFGNNFGSGFNGNGFNNGGGRMNSGGSNFGFNNFGSNSGGGSNRNNISGGGGGFGNNFNDGFDSGNNFGGGDNVYCIHMRGLPYYSYENDINDFFSPLRPINIEIIYNKRGLHSGTADVFFATADDAIQAMRKHKEQMGARYIELFYDGNTQKSGRI